jgi:hypothetical protein
MSTAEDVIHDAASRTSEAHKSYDEALVSAQKLDSKDEKEAAARKAQEVESARYEATVAAITAKVRSLDAQEFSVLVSKMIIRWCDFSMRHEQYNGHVQNLSNLCGHLMGEIRQLKGQLDAHKKDQMRHMEWANEADGRVNQRVERCERAHKEHKDWAVDMHSDTGKRFEEVTQLALDANVKYALLQAEVEYKLKGPEKATKELGELLREQAELTRKNARDIQYLFEQHPLEPQAGENLYLAEVETRLRSLENQQIELGRTSSEVSRLRFLVHGVQQRVEMLYTAPATVSSSSVSDEHMMDRMVSTIVGDDE